MQKFIVGLKDRALNTFGTVFTVRTHAEAVRSLTDEANNDKSNIAQHPEDYDLYNLGTIDDETGTITCDEGPTVIVRAQDLVRTQE